MIQEFHEVAIRFDGSEDEAAVTEAKAPEAGSKFFSTITPSATLTAWNIFLAIGGAFLTLYYYQVRYIPDLDWHEAFSYIVAISVLGGGLVAIYSFLLYVPGALWSEFLIFDTELRQYLCYSGPLGIEPCFRSILTDLVIPFAVLMTAIHFAMLGDDIRIVFATAVVCLLGISVYSLWTFRKILKRLEGRQRTSAGEPSLLIKYVGTAAIAASSSIASLLFLYALFGKRHTWSLLVVCTLVVVISNLLVAVQFRNRPARAILTGVLSALFLLTCGEILGHGDPAFSQRLLGQFGFGTRSVTLFVNADGREILQSYGIKTLVSYGSGATVGHTQILSRLGKEYLLEMDGHQVVLPKEMVLSWSAENPGTR